jgi:hypothetical protein
MEKIMNLSCFTQPFKLMKELNIIFRMISKSKGCLFVGGTSNPVGEIQLNKILRLLDHKIIECNWDSKKNGWSLMRERTDKSFPNGLITYEGNLMKKQD